MKKVRKDLAGPGSVWKSGRQLAPEESEDTGRKIAMPDRYAKPILTKSSIPKEKEQEG